LSTYAVVLAAGKGTRMESDLAKVLHRAAGRPLISWMLDLLEPLDVDHTTVVVGHQADAVRGVLPATVTTAFQAEQLGTGHAALIGLAAFEVAEGDRVLVLPGDMPLLRPESLQRLFDVHEREQAAATVLAVSLTDPASFGRIVRDRAGHVTEIVEARDATPDQLAIREVNTSVYLFDGLELVSALRELRPDNDQGELYLTDVVGILVQRGLVVAVASTAGQAEGQGVNTVAELDKVADALRADRDSC